MATIRTAILVASLMVAAASAGYALARPAAVSAQENEAVAIVWTSADADVAHRMTLMYSHAAKTHGWFDEVTLIIWGPSQRLLVADKDIQAKIAAMQADGVTVLACIACANSFGIADDIAALGIEVKGMGEPLSEHLKDAGTQVLTF